MKKGLALAIVQVLIVASLGATLALERARYPRVWVRTVPIDPDLPIRGRYVRLGLEVAIGSALDLPRLAAPVRPADSEGGPPRATAQRFPIFGEPRPVRLIVENDRLTAVPASPDSLLYARTVRRGDEQVAALVRPVAFFIPEDAPDPSTRPPGEELWAEVTVPPRGLPRPIRLGIARGGVITPIN
jgi:hypothetical protein